MSIFWNTLPFIYHFCIPHVFKPTCILPLSINPLWMLLPFPILSPKSLIIRMESVQSKCSPISSRDLDSTSSHYIISNLVGRWSYTIVMVDTNRFWEIYFPILLSITTHSLFFNYYSLISIILKLLRKRWDYNFLWLSLLRRTHLSSIILKEILHKPLHHQLWPRLKLQIRIQTSRRPTIFVE